MNKYLIELCLNLNDSFSNNKEELNTTGLIVLESFLVEEDKKEYFLTKNLPIIVNGILEDSKELYKKTKNIDKITKKDFILRIQNISSINFFNLK